LLARLQRQRQQYEQTARSAPPPPPANRQPEQQRGLPPRPRFQSGDKVFCLPYGEGIVQASRFDDGHELVRIEFTDYGAIEVDPSVSMVRRIAEAQRDEDEFLR